MASLGYYFLIRPEAEMGFDGIGGMGSCGGAGGAGAYVGAIAKAGMESEGICTVLLALCC
jgi:hypothetical protein